MSRDHYEPLTECVVTFADVEFTHLVEVAERIAAALEKIAGGVEQSGRPNWLGPDLEK